MSLLANYSDSHHSLTTRDVEASIADLSKVAGRSRANQISWLKDEARNAAARFLAASTMLNDEVPINQLPDEILREIFSQFAETMWPRHRWFHLSHICCRWRQVALGHHGLWSNITSANVGFVSACVQRSGTMPLSILWTTPSHNNNMESLKNTLFLCSARVRTFSLNGTFRCPVDWIALVPLQHLTTLHIDALTRPYSETTRMVVGSSLRNEVERWNLRTLELTSVGLDWTWASSALDRLRILRLSWMSIVDELQLCDLIRLLHRCSATLEVVSLNGINFAGVGREDLLQVELPSLRLLELTVFRQLSYVKALLSSVTIPETTRLCILNHPDPLSFEGPPLPSLASFFPRDSSRLGPIRAITSLEVDFVKKSFALRGLPEVVRHDMGSDYPLFEFTCQFRKDLPMPDGPLYNILASQFYAEDALIRVFTFNSVRTLSVSCNIYQLSIQNWHALLVFRELLYLTITHEGASKDTIPAEFRYATIFRILTTSAVSAPQNPVPQLVVPRLQQLRLCNHPVHIEWFTAAAHKCLFMRQANGGCAPLSIWAKGVQSGVPSQTSWVEVSSVVIVLLDSTHHVVLFKATLEGTARQGVGCMIIDKMDTASVGIAELVCCMVALAYLSFVFLTVPSYTFHTRQRLLAPSLCLIYAVVLQQPISNLVALLDVVVVVRLEAVRVHEIVPPAKALVQWVVVGLSLEDPEDLDGMLVVGVR